MASSEELPPDILDTVLASAHHELHILAERIALGLHSMMMPPGTTDPITTLHRADWLWLKSLILQYHDAFTAIELLTFDRDFEDPPLLPRPRLL